MTPAPATFSESWHRVSGQRVALRPGVRVRRQNYRGERWYVLENPFSNQFFRIRPAAYEFVARLRPARTVEEVWHECLDKFPDEAPGQQTVIQLLGQLYQANLLQYDGAGDAGQLFERYKQRKQREVQSRLLNVMFMRFPLLDPDQFLIRTMPVIGKLISPFGFLLWLLVIGAGVKVAFDNWSALWTQGQSVLAPANLPLLYAGLVILKTIHEFGHAYFCRKFGGEVHTMGVLLMIFTPVPYMDATASWGFRSRWKRALVGLAGMIVELFVAAIAIFVWARTGPGVMHNLAYNMLFTASVSTLIFNLNPLLRFDGYYILSDLLEIPNLQQRANRQLRHLGEHFVFGVKKSESPCDSATEKFWLTVFGICSGIYRVIVFGGVLLVVADRYFLLGILMAAACVFSWIIFPVSRFINYLSSSPQLDRSRPRAIAISAVGITAIIALLAIVPFPNHFRAPGVVEARERTHVATETAGYLEKLLAPAGARVTRGQPLFQLRNPELDLELAHAQATVEEMQTRLRQATADKIADVEPLTGRLHAALDRVAKLQADKETLTVKARHDGIWVAPGLEEQVGRWAVRGTRIGLLVNPSAFEFTATIKQEDADALFAGQARVPGAAAQKNDRSFSLSRIFRVLPLDKAATAEVRLRGEAADVLPVAEWRVIPGEQQTLPSPALGWGGGGEVPVSTEDPKKAAEPFFEVHANVTPASGVTVLHGRSGKIRFDLQPEPLLPRWLRRLQQLLQKRYQL